MVDAEAAGLVVAGERRAQRRRLHLIGAASRVTAAHEDVQRGQFAHHLRQDVGQLRAIGDAIDERQVLRLHRRPVHAVHVAVVEVVALEPPRLGEHLPPLVARIEPERPVAERHLALRGVGRRFRAHVEDEDVLRLADHQLLAIERQLVARRRPRRTSRASGSCSRSASVFSDGRVVDETSPRHEVQPLAVGRQRRRSCRPAAALPGVARRCRSDRRPRAPAAARLAPPGAASARSFFSSVFFCSGLVFSTPAGEQFVVRLKWRALAGLHRDEVDLRLLVEERLRLPRSPWAADGGHEVTVGEEVEPLAVRRPRRTVAVVSIGRHRRDAIALGDCTDTAASSGSCRAPCRRATCRRATR